MVLEPSRDISRLIEIMAALRDPNGGCPWDLKQDFSSIAPYTIEEAYEVADAIERNDLEDLRDELGDLLLQVIYHSQMANELGAFEFGDVVQSITEKMIRRHPHVFGDDAENPGWETIKAQERRDAGGGETQTNLLDDVPSALPALTRAKKLQRRASSVGFDWPDWREAFAKVKEETREVEEICTDDQTPSQERLSEEIGDLLFSVVNLARHLEIDPENALRGANQKFTRRIGAIEKSLAATARSMKDATLDEMEAAWQSAKIGEQSG